MNQPQSFCTNCGAPLTAVFCTQCGQPAASAVPPQPILQPAPYPTAPSQTVARRPVSSPAVADTTVVLPDHPWSTNPVGDQPAVVAPGRPGHGRSALIKAVIAFALVVALGLGAVFGYGWWRDRPVNQALSSAGKAVDSVLEPLGAATELADLSAAGEEAPQAVAVVEKALAGLEDESGDLAARARDVLRDEKALLEAMAPLASLSESSLAVWGTALPEVELAESAVLTSRRALAAVDSGAADAVADPGKAIGKAIEVVGGAADGSLTTELTGLLTELEKVRKTSATAALGERAGLAAEAAEAAGTGQSGASGERLAHLGDALGAIAGLSVMDPESLYVWGNAKSVLSESTSALDIDATATLDSMSAWVGKAQQKMDDWQTTYDNAEAARSNATAGLDSYAETVRQVLRDYDQARDGTADALEAAELDDYSASYDVEYAMEEGVLTRQDLLNQLMAARPPAGLGVAHEDLASVIEGGVEAMTTGEQAVEDWNACYLDCTDSFRDMAGWQQFSAASANISDRFDSARRAWDAALASALRAANTVPLPPMPKV